MAENEKPSYEAMKKLLTTIATITPEAWDAMSEAVKPKCEDCAYDCEHEEDGDDYPGMPPDYCIDGSQFKPKDKPTCHKCGREAMATPTVSGVYWCMSCAVNALED